MADSPGPGQHRLTPETLDKLTRLFLLMTSEHDGEKLAALSAFGRALKTNNVDYHMLVARMAKGWLDADAKKLFQGEIANALALGRAEGQREAESKRGIESDFSNIDGSDNWRKQALYIDREKQRLPLRDRTDWCLNFIDDMATRARLLADYEPSPRQLVQLRKFFVRLGGKIT